MRNIRQELLLREEEAKNLIQFLAFIEAHGELSHRFRSTEEFDFISVMTSIRAGMALMLYNAVESTITKGLERLHEAFIEESLTFEDCNDQIKQLLFIYYENMREKSPNVHNRVPHMLRFYDYMKGGDTFPLTYKQLSRFYSLYSGNLDAREILSVLKKYGISFDRKISELKTIKDDRNHLAHGELTFEEVGRNLSVDQLKKMREKTFQYLEDIIDAMEKFILEKKFKHT